MPEPISPPPKTEEPMAPQFSDRAALEAAILGAASLIMGRVLLGRGAGLLAGAAAVAARLASNGVQRDTAGSAANPDPETTGPTPERGSSAAAQSMPPSESPISSPTAPLSPKAVIQPASQVPGINQAVTSPATSGASPMVPPSQAPGHASHGAHSGQSAWKATAAPAAVTGNTAPLPLINPRAPQTAIPLPPWVAGPAPKPEPEVFPSGLEHAMPAAFAGGATSSGKADDPPAAGDVSFPDIFLETSPKEEPLPALTTPSGEVAGVLTEAGIAGPLPTFPKWTRVPLAERDQAGPAKAIPAPTEQAPLPETALPLFPEISSPPPDPNEIWKLVGEETKLVPAADASHSIPGSQLSSGSDSPESENNGPIEDLPAFPIPVRGKSAIAAPEPAARTIDPGKPAIPDVKQSPLFEKNPPLSLDPPLTPLNSLTEKLREVDHPAAELPPPAETPPAGIDSSLHLPRLTVQIPSVTAIPSHLTTEPTAPPASSGPVIPALHESPSPPIANAPSMLAHPLREPIVPVVSEVIPLRAETSGPVAFPKTSAINPEDMAKPGRGGAWKVWTIIGLIIAALLWLWRSQHTPTPEPVNLGQPATAPAPSIASSEPVSLPPAPSLTPAAASAIPVVQVIPAPNPEPVPIISPRQSADASIPVVYGEPLPGVSQDLPPDSPEAKGRQTLEKLLAASSFGDLTNLVHEPADVQKQYGGGPINPTSWKRILFDASEKMPQSAHKHHLFRVVTDEVPLGFPVVIADTGSGPRIDYSAFVQCRDQLLDKFMEAPTTRSQPFLATLRRGHYFGNAVPQAELDKLICLEIASPNPSSPKHIVFIQRGTELGRLVLNKYTWDRLYTPILELGKNGDLVQITSILGDMWQKPRRSGGKLKNR